MIIKDIKPHKRKLSVKEKKFIQYCELFYFKNNNGFPTPEQAALALRYSISEINVFLQNLNVQKSLEVRGLPWKSAGAQSGQLTQTQIAAAITMCNFADERSVMHKLDELGVTPVQYYAWLQQPIFNDFVNNMADRNMQNVRPEALTKFTQLVRDGDFQAMKYYFEVTGQFSNGNTVENLQVVIQRLIEIIQKHVEPEKLAVIAQEILGAAPVTATGVNVNLDLNPQPTVQREPVRVKSIEQTQAANRTNVLTDGS